MPDRPKNSRFSRMPGLRRIGDARPSDPRDEPQRISLYVAGRLLDAAEELAIRSGNGVVQTYCEGLLGRAIQTERDRVRVEESEVKHGPMKSLDALTEDPASLAEWTSSVRIPHEDRGEPVPLDGGIAAQGLEPTAIGAREVVLRHAGMGIDDPEAFLARLRNRSAISPESARELLDALEALEAELRGVDQIDRRLALALHRLAFEGQILLTDPQGSVDSEPAAVDLARTVQEAVDRVISGEDIRYYSEETDGF